MVNLPKPRDESVSAAIVLPGTQARLSIPGGGPQRRPIKVLHRHDGYISFMVRSSGETVERFAIHASVLDQIFPEFTVQLMRDSFVSINAGYTLADRSRRSWGPSIHRTDFLRYLCACYCDLDYYNHGLQRPQVVFEIERMWANGELPNLGRQC